LYSFPNQDGYYFYKGGAIAEKSGEDINYAGTTFRSRPDWTHEPRHQHDLFQDKSKTVSVVTAGLEPSDNWICNDYWCGRKPERDARDLGYIVPFKNAVIVPVPLKSKDNYGGKTYGDLYRTRNPVGKFEETGVLGTGRGVIMGFNGIPIFPEKKVNTGISGIVEQSKKTPRVQGRDELNLWERVERPVRVLAAQARAAHGKVHEEETDKREFSVPTLRLYRGVSRKSSEETARTGNVYTEKEHRSVQRSHMEPSETSVSYWTPSKYLAHYYAQERAEGHNDPHAPSIGGLLYVDLKLPYSEHQKVMGKESMVKKIPPTPEQVKQGIKGSLVGGDFYGYTNDSRAKFIVPGIDSYPVKTNKKPGPLGRFETVELNWESPTNPIKGVKVSTRDEKKNENDMSYFREDPIEQREEKRVFIVDDLISSPTKAELEAELEVELETPTVANEYKYKLTSPMTRTIEPSTEKPLSEKKAKAYTAESEKDADAKADEIVKGLEETSTK
jgi:hypothetical protein